MCERCKAKTSGGPSQQEDGAVGKLGYVWNHGVCLGVNRKTEEIAVRVKSGVFTTRTVRRKPIDDRCKPAAMELIISVPWRTNEEDPRADGDPFEALHMPEDAALSPSGPRPEGDRASPRVCAEELRHHQERLGAAQRLDVMSWVCFGHWWNDSSGPLRRMPEAFLLKGTEKCKRTTAKFLMRVEKVLAKQDEEDRKRRQTDENQEDIENDGKMVRP